MAGMSKASGYSWRESAPSRSSIFAPEKDSYHHRLRRRTAQDDLSPETNQIWADDGDSTVKAFK
jgi:hypothetical protein